MDTSVAENKSIPWQDRNSIGFFKAIWKTIKYVLFKPNEFFDNLVIENSIKGPYLFYFIVSSCGGIIAIAISMLIKPIEAGPYVFIFASLLMIIFSSFGLFIGSGILHLGVMLLRGTGGYKGTLNVMAYSTSTNIFQIIPFIGGLIGGIWGVVVGIKGFKKIHNFSTARAIFAYFSIFIIVFIIAFFAALVIPNILKARTDAKNNAAVKTIAQTVSTNP